MSDGDTIRLVRIASVASQPDIVLVAAAPLREGNDVIKFDLIVLQMFVAVLTCIVITPHNPDLHLEGDVTPASTELCRFRERFRGIDHRADVSEDGLHFCDYSRDLLRIVRFIEVFQLFPK